jgi:hypothetical protein
MVPTVVESVSDKGRATVSESRRAPNKMYWHPLSLQQLAPGHFSRVVNSILSERLMLISSWPKRHGARVERGAAPRS